jgi:hypothetical protein
MRVVLYAASGASLFVVPERNEANGPSLLSKEGLPPPKM